MSVSPLVSVVMPSFNQARFINEAVRSVLDQSYASVELIVCDGGSSDGTLEILERLNEQYKNLRWQSEPDNGPADGLNKAIQLCRGTIVGWLNSDDVYAQDAIKSVVAFFDENQDSLMVYGQGDHIDEVGVHLGVYPTSSPEKGLKAFENGCFICQPTVFFKRSMYALLGPINETLKTTFDFEYWMRAFSSFEGRIGFIDKKLANSRLHGQCITRLQRLDVATESLKLCAQYLGHGGSHWLVSYFEEVRSLKDRNWPDHEFEHHCREVIHSVENHMNEGEAQALLKQFSS